MLMKKISTITIPLIFCYFSAFCQVGKQGSVNVSIGGEGLFPNSSLRQTHHPGGGLNIKGEYVFAKHTSVTSSIGYNYLAGKKSSVKRYENVKSIPIKAGLRYYLGNFYAMGEAGVLIERGFEAGQGIIFAVAMGDEIVRQANGNSLDISLRYERWGTRIYSSVVGLRVAYEFRLK
jgi:hypothetical protein